MKRSLFAAGAALLFTGTLAFADIRTDYDHQADFSTFHSYSWGQVKTDDPLAQSRVKAEIDKDLQARGWQLMPSGGQTMVFVTDNIKTEKELETNYDSFGGGWGGGWGYRGFRGFGGGFGPGGFGTSTTQQVDQQVGHLVVDIFESSNHNLLFRGIADNDLGNNADKNTKNVDKNIDKIFKKFPGQGKG